MMDKYLLTVEESLLLRLCVDAPINDGEFDWGHIDIKQFITKVCGHGMFGWLLFHTYIAERSTYSNNFWQKIDLLAKAIFKTSKSDLAKKDSFISDILGLMEKK